MLRLYDLYSSISMGNLGEIIHKQKSQIRRSQFVTSIKLHVEVKHVLAPVITAIAPREKSHLLRLFPTRLWFLCLYQSILFWLLYLALMVSLFLLCSVCQGGDWVNPLTGQGDFASPSSWSLRSLANLAQGLTLPPLSINADIELYAFNF